MKRIKTLNNATLKNSAAKGGCGECQTSCQSACKTSCTVANQKCEKKAQLDLIKSGTRCFSTANKAAARVPILRLLHD